MRVLATVHDVELRLGRTLVDPELSRVVGLLEDASELVCLEANTEWRDPDDESWLPIPRGIRGVVLRVVDRVARNPEGFSAESDGDYSYQRTQVQSGGVYLTDADKAIIRKACGRTGLWTQPLERGDQYLRTIWFEDSFGCELFPVDVVRDYD
jgi:hypothetical protein